MNLLKKLGLGTASLLLSVATLILVLVGGNQSVPKQELGNTRMPHGIETGRSLIFTGDGLVELHTLSLGSGEITAAYTNNNAYTEFVRFGQITSNGTASSSFDYYLFASTSASVATQHNFTDLVPGVNSRVLTGTLATSTAATTTSSMLGIVSGKSDVIVMLKKGEPILLALQKGDMNCPSIPAVNGCEYASSTARGFNLSALIEVVATSTTQTP